MQSTSKIRKVLFIILGVVFVAAIAVGIWASSQNQSVKKEQAEIRNVNVQSLAAGEETKIGTVIYGAAKKDGEVKTENGNNTVNLTTTDSVDGAFNIYYQDVLNRYKSYEVSKKTISKDDALTKNARVIVVSGQTGKITITVWGDDKGMSHVEIVTSADFK